MRNSHLVSKNYEIQMSGHGLYEAINSSLLLFYIYLENIYNRKLFKFQDFTVNFPVNLGKFSGIS